MNVSGSVRYQGMEGLRAYAVILTFFVHYFTYVFGAFHKENPNNLNIVSAYDLSGSIADSIMIYFFRGQYGVDLFFILSGFLIARVLGRSSGGYVSFALNRLYRIYPVFLASLVVAIIAKVYMVPHMPLEFVRVLKSLFLVYIDYNYPSWSLRYELIFYFSVPFFYSALNRFFTIGVAYRSALIFVFFGILLFSSFPRASMFVAGMIIASFSDEELKSISSEMSDWVVLGVTLSATTAYALTPDYLRLMPFFAAAFSMLMISAVYGSGFINRIFTVWPMRFIGNISYSFYMIHGPSITIGYWITTRLVKPPTAFETGLYVFMFSFAVTILLSLIFFYALELPYFNKKRKEKSMKREAAATTVVS